MGIFYFPLQLLQVISPAMTNPQPPDNALETLAKILERMSAKASEMNLRGTSAAGYFDANKTLISQAKDCGKMFENNFNSLAVAFSKIAEMCDTLKNSGSQVRPPYKGEFGWVGGAIKQVGAIYYVAAFSGAKGEEDLAIAEYGLAIV